MLEDVGEQVTVLAGVNTIHLVKRAHHRTNLAILHRRLERWCVDLLQRAFVELRVSLEPVLLLGVHLVVLGGRHDGMALDALDVGNGHLP